MNGNLVCMECMQETRINRTGSTRTPKQSYLAGGPSLFLVRITHTNVLEYSQYSCIYASSSDYTGEACRTSKAMRYPNCTLYRTDADLTHGQAAAAGANVGFYQPAERDRWTRTNKWLYLQPAGKTPGSGHWLVSGFYCFLFFFPFVFAHSKQGLIRWCYLWWWLFFPYKSFSHACTGVDIAYTAIKIQMITIQLFHRDIARVRRGIWIIMYTGMQSRTLAAIAGSTAWEPNFKWP